MPSPKGYSRTQIALHWGVAVLIVLQFVLHEPIAEAWEVILRGGAAAFDPVTALHVFGGLAILGFVIWRLVLRARRGVPPVVETNAMQKLAAHVVHLGLYGLMVLMPLSGAVAWFGGVEAAGEAHEVMKPLLLLLVALHVLGALWHQFWLKDGLMLRMKRAAD